MAKVRVYELAKELGLESKELLAKLQEVGEFVRSASSTVEAPVVRKLMDKFPELVPAEAAPKTKKAPAKKAAAKQTVKVEDLPPELQQMIEDATPTTPPTRAAAPSQPPRAANNPFSSTPSALPRPPRAGNNPFSSGAGPRPPARPIRPGEAGRGGEKLKPGQRPPMSGARPGSVRPGFAARPAQNNPRPNSGGPSTRPSTSSSPYPLHLHHHLLVHHLVVRAADAHHNVVVQRVHLAKVVKVKIKIADKRVRKKDVKILKIYQHHN